eukprot:GHVU01113895.1.p1 GENE.GHVU01113895.1~~GHVU01113895.1.p1  ORF type:complete len:126 (+),score=12.43 GHVU01113895.1:28-378(+)
MGIWTKLVVLGVIGWFSYNITTIYFQNLPPLAKPGIPLSRTAKAAIKDGDIIDYSFRISGHWDSIGPELATLAVPYGWDPTENLRNVTKSDKKGLSRVFDPLATYHLELEIPEPYR